jgi:uncharacterized membrane protein YfcA
MPFRTTPKRRSAHVRVYSRPVIDPAQVVAGFSVGTIVGLTGVGGGALMTPLLVLLFGVHPATAVGTDLLHAAISKAGGTYVHASKRRVEWRISVLLAAGSVPAAILTLVSLHVFTGGLGNAALITTALGIALLLTAIALAARLRGDRPAEPALGGADTRHPAFTVATGVALGVLVSLSSVGAGALGVTALLILYPHLAAQKIVASDLAHAVPLTFVAGLGHWVFGSVNWVLLLSLLVGSLPGIYLGSNLAGFVPERLLRVALIAMLSLIGVRMIVA